MTRNRCLSACMAMLLVGIATPVHADVLDTPIPAPAWTKTIGTLRVEKYGSGTPALVLIPGLGCGSWSWRDTIAREAPKRTLYAITLAGFDGTPLTPDAGLDGADRSLATLLSTEKLDRPILVGHSLGGLVALRFGTEHAAQLRGIVSVDGPPVFPLYAQSTAAQRDAAAEQLASSIRTQTPAQYQAAEGAIMRDYVTDAALAAHATTLVARTDQNAMALYAAQVFSADIRPLLVKLTVPAVLIAPVPGVPLPTYLPPAMANMSQSERSAATVGFYASLVAGAPALRIVPIENSRHFVMLDQPAAFAKALDDFIATVT